MQLESYQGRNVAQQELEPDEGGLEEAGSCQAGVVVPLHWVVGRPVEQEELLGGGGL